MGLISGLLCLPVSAPVRGFRFVLEKLRDEADAVLHDEGRAFAELIELSMRHHAGELSDAEFAEQETQLLERLGSIRDQREALRHAASGDGDAEYEVLDDDAQGSDADYEVLDGEADEDDAEYEVLDDDAGEEDR